MEVTSIMEGIAFIALGYASVAAFFRYKESKEITNLWLLITIALVLFSFASFTNIFEESLSAVMRSAVENVKINFLLVGSTLLFSALCLYNKEKKLLKDGVHKKVKEYDKKRFESMKRWLDAW